MSFNLNVLQNFLPEADTIFQDLEKIEFYTPKFRIKNRSVKSKRSIAAFGDEDLTYNYCGSNVTAQNWTPLILRIRDKVERETGCAFNFVLINRFSDGSEYLPQQKSHENATFPLAVLGFGETRKLTFKRPPCENKTLNLENGSLCIVESNELYTFGVPSDISKKNCHINLCFLHILKSPSAKKVRTDDEETQFPDDCLSQLCVKTLGLPEPKISISPMVSEQRSPQQSSSLIAEWDLGDHVYAQVHYHKHSVRLHLRQFTELLVPTKNGVSMINKT